MHSTRDILRRRRLYLAALMVCALVALIPQEQRNPAAALRALQDVGHAVADRVAARMAEFSHKDAPQ